MLKFQHELIELAMAHHVLSFGNYTLKSGRKSPYFFNAGLFYDADALKQLGEFYAEAILEASLDFDVLFGPAYKGISLATATGIALAARGYKCPLAFNRKEKKDHGEGGNLIGAPLTNKRVLILDDVITAGTAFYESKALIEANQGLVVGVVVMLDRQEKTSHGLFSTLQEIQKNEGFSAISLITFSHLIEHFEDSEILSSEMKNNLLAYQAEWGVTL